MTIYVFSIKKSELGTSADIEFIQQAVKLIS